MSRDLVLLLTATASFAREESRARYAQGLELSKPGRDVEAGWHVAAGGTERGGFYGDRMSYIMARPEHSPNTQVTISKDGKTVIDANGYPEGDVKIVA